MLTALFMLHLTFVASDAACATHMVLGHAAMGAAAVVMHAPPQAMDMGAETVNQHAGSQRHPQRPCDTPAQPNCCQALATCGTAFTASATRSNAPPRSHAGVARSVVDMPVSELTAPDTPPPKA